VTLRRRHQLARQRWPASVVAGGDRSRHGSGGVQPRRPARMLRRVPGVAWEPFRRDWAAPGCPEGRKGSWGKPGAFLRDVSATPPAAGTAIILIVTDDFGQEVVPDVCHRPDVGTTRAGREVPGPRHRHQDVRLARHGVRRAPPDPPRPRLLRTC
jgi:hypothetical protein